MSSDEGSSRSQGSALLGFLVACLGGCAGFAAVWVFAKGAHTKKGALLGLIAWTAAVCVIWLTHFTLSSASG